MLLKVKETFDNVDQLNNYIIFALDIAIEESAKEVHEYAKKYIQKNWYDKYQPKSYQRTMDFLNSLVVTNADRHGNSVSSHIYFDTSRIRSTIRNNRAWSTPFNPHTSFKGSDSSSMIPMWIENGNSSIKGRRDSVSIRGLHSLERTLEYYNNGDKFATSVRRKLKNLGLDVI